jgi:hypothetical protein
MSQLYNTGVASFGIQILSAILDIYALVTKTDPSLAVIRTLLMIELAVQFVEGSFYYWMITNFQQIKNITPFRYYDWALTTPTMLFTFCVFLMYVRNREEQLVPASLTDLLTPTAVNVIAAIVCLNAAMLAFGYFTEKGYMGVVAGTAAGFVPFVLMFYLVYMYFAQYTTTGTYAFYAFAGVWALYGIAALTHYKTKNIAYNILDLFSKNFFGFFLAFLLLTSPKV